MNSAHRATSPNAREEESGTAGLLRALRFLAPGSDAPPTGHLFL